jgi:hypothetical protein
LGFWQAPTGDAWRHPYGVVTDGRVVLGLHQAPDFSALTFVHPDVAALAAALDEDGVPMSVRHVDAEEFNRIEFTDPAGQKVRVVAARTFSPADRVPEGDPPLGHFAHYGMPVRDLAAVASFWEPRGFVLMAEEEEPYPHHSLISDGIDLALHSPRLLPAPVLVFCQDDMAGRIARLRDAGVKFESLPRGLDAPGHALLEAPEGTLLLLLTGTL